MPASSLTHLSTVMHFVQWLRPTRVLDVGVGNGAYGLLSRQYLDIAHERVAPEKWQHTIDGLEIFEGYRNPVWSYFYNRITIGDARQLINSIDTYDLILFNDVLEHMRREEAQALVATALSKATTVIATTPAGEYEQGAWGGNEAERHLCTLAPSDFADVAASLRTGDTWFIVASRDPATVSTIKDAAAACPGWRPSRMRMFSRRVARKLQRMMFGAPSSAPRPGQSAAPTVGATR